MEFIIALFFIVGVTVQVSRLICWIFSLISRSFVWMYRFYKNYKKSIQISDDVLKSYGLTRYQYDNLHGKFFRKEVEDKITAQKVLEGI
jgi:hypothetical protein